MGTLTIRVTPAGQNPLVVGGHSGIVQPNNAVDTAENTSKYFMRLVMGPTSSNSAGNPLGTVVRFDVNPVAALGTWTTASGTGAQTLVINGVSIGITWATSDTVSAALMAAAVNASVDPLVRGLLTAASAAGVVTLTALPGRLANSITLAATGTGASTGAVRMAGGTDGTTNTIATSAAGTFTSAGGSGSQSIVINGVTFTSVWATSDTLSIAALATLVMASQDPRIRGVVVPTIAAGVMTVTASRKGTLGNAITTTASGTGMTAGATTLLGGLEALATQFTY